MTEEDKKLIAGYMGWDIVTVGAKKRPYKIYVDSKDCNIHHEFDLNDAGLCVQEIQKRGDWNRFLDHGFNSLIDVYGFMAHNFIATLFRAENFFGAMAAWLRKEGKK